MSYVYRHIRLDKNEVFYVGIGSDDNYSRARSTDRKNPHWKNIVNKSGHDVEIIMDDLTWDQAAEKEKEFIKLYGRRDLGLGTLINLTDGGEGAPGLVISEESKARMRDSSRKRIITPELRKIYSDAAKSMVCSNETRRKISEAGKRRVYTPEYCAKISLILKGKKFSEEHIKNNSISQYKFNKDQIVEIKKLHEQGMSNSKIGNIYGVASTTIRSIIIGKSYKYIAA